MKTGDVNLKIDKQIEKDKINNYLRITLNYQKGLLEGKKFLWYLKHNNGTKSDFRFCYYMIAMFYRELEKPRYALKNLKKAYKYSSNIDYKMDNDWVKAQIFQDLKINNKALKLYKRCYDYYYSLGLKEYYSGILCNIGEITHDELLIKRSIKIYERALLKKGNENDRENVLKEMNKILISTFTYNKYTKDIKAVKAFI